MCNFEEKVNCRYQILIDNKNLKERTGETIKYYQWQEDRYGTIIFKEINEEINKEWRNAIAERKISGKVIFYNIIGLLVEPLIVHDHLPFNNKIARAIERGIAVAASDASCKDRQMAEY